MMLLRTAAEADSRRRRVGDLLKDMVGRLLEVSVELLDQE